MIRYPRCCLAWAIRADSGRTGSPLTDSVQFVVLLPLAPRRTGPLPWTRSLGLSRISGTTITINLAASCMTLHGGRNLLPHSVCS
jgi:hypothetical protein